MNGQTNSAASPSLVAALVDRLRRSRGQIADTTLMLDNQADRVFGPIPQATDPASGKPDGGYLLNDLNDAVDQLDRAIRANQEAAVRLQPIA